MIIHAQKGGSLNDQERLELAKLLIKAGYTVRIVAMKVGNTTVKGVEANEPPR